MRLLVTLPLAAALALPASIAMPVRTAIAAPADGKDEEAAKAAYQEGTRHYEIGNYEDALESWVSAYALVPDDEEHMEILGKLRLNIARAHEKIFEIHGDPANLRRARALLETHIRVLPDIYADEPQLLEEAQREAQERLDRIEALLDGSEPGPDPAPVPTPVGDSAHPVPVPAPAPVPAEDPMRAPADSAPAGKPGKGFVITGSVLTVLGVGGLGLMGAGMGMASSANSFSNELDGREDQISKGYTGNALAVGGAIGGAVFLVTGVTLLAVGVSKNKKARMAARLSPGFAGLTFSGRF